MQLWLGCSTSCLDLLPDHLGAPGGQRQGLIHLFEGLPGNRAELPLPATLQSTLHQERDRQGMLPGRSGLWWAKLETAVIMGSGAPHSGTWSQPGTMPAPGVLTMPQQGKGLSWVSGPSPS